MDDLIASFFHWEMTALDKSCNNRESGKRNMIVLVGHSEMLSQHSYVTHFRDPLDGHFVGDGAIVDAAGELVAQLVHLALQYLGLSVRLGKHVMLKSQH